MATLILFDTLNWLKNICYYIVKTKVDVVVSKVWIERRLLLAVKEKEFAFVFIIRLYSLFCIPRI